MTVNERLFSAGLLEDFDAAVASEDLSSINEILEKVGLQQDDKGMNWTLEKESKGPRKTLGLKDTSDATANLNKKGRGWKISEARLDELHAQARERRRFSSNAHKALAKRFSEADLGRHTFKRHAVVGSAIVDFNCHSLGMAVDIFEDGDNEQLASRRDKSLEAVGIKVMRVRASDILEDMDKVLERITLGMRARIADKRDAKRFRENEDSRNSGNNY